MKTIITAFLVLTFALLSLGAGTKTIMPNNSPAGSVTTTYKNSNVDTLTFYRPAGMAAGTFAAHWSDSVSVTNVKVRRMVDGEWMASQVGDTLTAFTAFLDTSVVSLGISGTAGNPSSTTIGTLTVAPLPDAYIFFVTYASSNNGVTNNNVTYKVNWTRNN